LRKPDDTIVWTARTPDYTQSKATGIDNVGKIGPNIPKRQNTFGRERVMMMLWRRKMNELAGNNGCSPPGLRPWRHRKQMSFAGFQYPPRFAEGSIERGDVFKNVRRYDQIE
jgi:hypothetical protein